MKPTESRFWPERGRNWLIAYALASLAYRVGLLIAVAWMLYEFFKARDLEIVGELFAIAAVTSLVIGPLVRLFGMARVPGQLERVPRRRPALIVGLLLLLGLAVAFIPLPNHVSVPLVLAPRDAARVYVTTPGLLDTVLVHPGSRVRKGEELAKLTSPDVTDELVKLQGEVAESKLLLRTLERQRVTEPAVAAQIPAAREKLDDLEKRLTRLENEQRRLTLKSPVDGEILPPAPIAVRPSSDGRLPTWADTPLKPENRGCYLEHQTLFCLVGDPRRVEGVLIIDQSQVEYLRPGDRVDVQLDELPGRTFSGKLGEIAQLDVESVPEQLSHKWGGDLATRRDDQGRERPANTSYQARVAIDDDSGLLILGTRGRAKVFARAQTLGERLWRSLRGTLHWP
jgi:putative peptide zinc metalloprotease protein